MSDFQILSEKIHCLKRPAMYIGSISEENISGIINFKYQTKSVIPGLVKIIEEIYQNAVDESIRTNFKYGTNITIDIKNDGLFGWYCEISDNGRGIPLNQVDGIYQAELCWTRARAGSNFGKDEDRITIGTNGLGSFLTNVYSTKFVGISGNGEEHVVVTCSNNCDNVHSVLEKSKKRGTTVKFYPDLSFFNTNEISEDIINIIKDRLYNLAICYPELKIKFNNELLVIKDSKQLSKLVSDNAISLDSKNYNIVITNSGDDEEFRHLSYFNGIAIKNGGSHIDYIISGICEELIPLIKRKWKITVLPNQIKQHLLICFWVRSFPNPRFDSQSKERITNTNGEIKQFFDIDFSKLVKKIMLEDSIIMPMIESILRKKEAQDKRAATLALKKTQKKKIVNHIEATDKNPENKILHICEGLSASGQALSVRNPITQGFYSLRGKILNTHELSTTDIVKNKELAELITIIGLDLDSNELYENPDELFLIEFNDKQYIIGKNDSIIVNNKMHNNFAEMTQVQITDKLLITYKSQSDVIRKSGACKLNYGKILVLVDQDQDGSNIFCLLLKFFSRWPQLFYENRILRINTPLYILSKKGKADVYFYTSNDYNSNIEKYKGYELSFIKGLGSLHIKNYSDTIIENPKLDSITIDDINILNMAFGDDANLRKDWILNDE